MAVTLTRNLKLRVSSNLTSDAKYNLNRIDALGATFLVDDTEALNIRSKTDINILPEDASTGGAGVGGIVNISTPSQLLDSVNLYSTLVNVGKNPQIDDSATGGNKKLRLNYKSDVNGPVDTVADRTLSIDLDGANRSLVLAGNFTLLGFNTTFNATATTNLILPVTGTLATLAGAETLTNKTIDASSNNILNLMNINVAANAAIAYSKLNLANSIVNADINSAAGIVYSKLSIVNSVVNADINASAAIAYSKLNLSASIVNADISPSANISASKINLINSITDAQVASGAAIQGTKISPDFGSQNIVTSGQLQLEGPSFKTSIQAATSGQVNDLTLVLPIDAGTSGQILSTDGAGNLSWLSASGTGSVTSVGLTLPAIFSVSGSPVTTSGTLAASLVNQNANTMLAGPSSGGATAPTFRSLVLADLPASIPYSQLSLSNSIVNADINASAAIDATKIADGSVTNTEFQYVGGLTSDAQTQLNNKQPIDADLTALAALATNGLIARTGSGTAATRTVTGQAYLPVSNGDGVSGDPTISLDINAATSTTVAANDEVLIADVSAANAIRKVLVSDIAGAAVSTGFATNWTSGTTFTATHNLGSRDVIVELFDNVTYETVLVDTVIRTDTNNVDFTSSSAPTGAGLRVLIKKI